MSSLDVAAKGSVGSRDKSVSLYARTGRSILADEQDSRGTSTDWRWFTCGSPRRNK